MPVTTHAGVTPGQHVALLEGIGSADIYEGSERWTPDELGAALVADFDASLLSSLTLDGSNRVSAWVSRVGGISAAQGTQDKQPIYSATGLNSLPAIGFDGSNDCLAISAVGSLPVSTAARTIMWVAHSNASGWRELYSQGGTTGGTFSEIGVSNGGYAFGSTATAAADTISTTTWNGATLIFSWNVDAGVTPIALAYANGAAPYSRTLSTLNTSTTPGYIGSSKGTAEFWSGPAQEILVFNRSLSPQEERLVEGWLAWKWGLVSNLPNWHPYKLVAPTLANIKRPYDYYNFVSNALARLESWDAATWYNQPIKYTPNGTDSVRDPSVHIINGTYWLAHTVAPNASTACTNFALASSTDGRTFTYQRYVDCTAVVGNDANSRTWAPEFFVEADGTVRIYFAGSTSGASNFKIYETHATAADLSTWSTPVQIAGTSLPSNMIDAFMVKRGSTYYLWYKNETTKYIELLSSSAPTTDFVVAQSGDWAGWGSGLEGASVIQLDDGRWKIWLNAYASSQMYESVSSDDWATWSTKTLISAPYQPTHGTVMRGT